MKDQCLITRFLGRGIGLLGLPVLGLPDFVCTAEIGPFVVFDVRMPSATWLVKLPLMSEVNCQNIIPAFHPL